MVAAVAVSFPAVKVYYEYQTGHQWYVMVRNRSCHVVKVNFQIHCMQNIA